MLLFRTLDVNENRRSGFEFTYPETLNPQLEICPLIPAKGQSVNLYRIKLAGMLFIMPFLLAGCTVYEEHVTLDGNGGVTADISINNQALAQIAPEAADPMVLKAMLGHSKPPDVDMTIEKAGDSMHFKFVSKKAADLIEWGRNEQNPLGNATVQALDGYLDITRKVVPSSEFHWQNTPGVTMVFKLSAPGTLVSSNSTRQEGETAVWEVNPSELLSGEGKTFTARFKTSTPWMTYMLIALMVAGAIGFFVFLRKKTMS